MCSRRPVEPTRDRAPANVIDDLWGNFAAKVLKIRQLERNIAPPALEIRVAAGVTLCCKIAFHDTPPDLAWTRSVKQLQGLQESGYGGCGLKWLAARGRREYIDIRSILSRGLKH